MLLARPLLTTILHAMLVLSTAPFVLAAEPSTKAKRHNDLVFAEVDGQKLLLDLYLPPEGQANLPTEQVRPLALVVYIHGGSWIGGSRKECPVSGLAEHGFAVASISYRFSNRAIFPAQIHDCKGAIRWLRAHAKEYGFDTERIGVAGSSAGGHLAVLLGTSGDVKELEGEVGGNLDQSSKVKAIVDFYGPADFILRSKTQPSRADKPGSSTHGLLGGPASEKVDLARLASGVTHVTADDAPLLIFHGDRDTTVLLDQSERLRDVYKAAGLPVTLHVLPGAGHGGEAFASEENRRRVQEFFSLHLGTSPTASSGE
jgi:acetyl esterase/lipase